MRKFGFFTFNLLLFLASQGQVFINSTNTFVITSFDSWNGNMPIGFVNNTSYISSNASTTGGTYAILNEGLGWQPSSSVSSLSIVGTFKNTTGSTQTSVTIEYDAFESVNRVSREPGWSVSSSLGSVASLNWSYNSVATPSLPETKNLTINSLSILNNATFTITWTSDRGLGTGYSPLIGLRNIKVKLEGATSCGGPSNQATSGLTSSIDNTTATLSWTKGASSDGSVVVLNEGTAITNVPTNGMAHAADVAYGSGASLGSSADYVVFRNTSGTSVNLTGLSAATNYHYTIYDYMSTGNCYNLTSPATGSFTTTCSTPGDVAGENASNGDSESEVSWTLPACYDEIVLFVDVTSSIGTSPTGDGTAYSANSAYTSVGQCVYKGTGTNVIVTGLTNGTTYNFEIFTRKGTTWSSGVEVNATPVLPGFIISAIGTTYTIDFDNTVSGVNNGAFTGSGFAPNPTSGQLNSGAWSLTGMSDGALAFNGTGTSGDYARGTSNGGVTIGGVYAKTLGTGDIALGIQPGSSDFTPGTITLKTANTTGSSITHIEIAYDVYVYNDEDRSNDFNFSYSTDDVTYTDISALDVVSEEIALITPSWERNGRFALITLPSSLANNSNFYLRWSGDEVSGSGSADEFALDNIAVTFHTSAPSSLLNNIITSELSTLVVSEINATLGANVTVNKLTLENAVLSLGNHRLTVDEIEGGNSSAFINTNGTGAVRRNFTGTGDFSYPIGTSSDYTPISFDFTTGTFLSAYVDVRAIASIHASNMSSTDYLDRYWEINESGITSFTCDVVANYVAADVQGTEANIYGGLYSSGAWSIGSVSNTSNNTIGVNGTTHFSELTGGELTLLPVDLISFAATKKTDCVELNWKTASELNNSHFDVLYSIDGKKYEQIGRVLGNGNSNTILNYNHTHTEPQKINYYQLRQVDFNGTTELSQQLAVRFDIDFKPFVIKNFTNKFEIMFTIDDQRFRYQLLDNIGRTLDEGYAKGTLTLDKTTLAKGQYFLYFSNERTFEVVKLFK